MDIHQPRNYSHHGALFARLRHYQYQLNQETIVENLKEVALEIWLLIDECEENAQISEEVTLIDNVTILLRDKINLWNNLQDLSKMRTTNGSEFDKKFLKSLRIKFED